MNFDVVLVRARRSSLPIQLHLGKSRQFLFAHLIFFVHISIWSPRGSGGGIIIRLASCFRLEDVLAKHPPDTSYGSLRNSLPPNAHPSPSPPSDQLHRLSKLAQNEPPSQTLRPSSFLRDRPPSHPRNNGQHIMPTNCTKPANLPCSGRLHTSRIS